MSYRYRVRTSLAAACAVVLLAPDFALAQGELEEIIVTARRRNESAQSVPIAITAIGGEEIAKRNIVSGEDLEHAVPGLTLGTVTGRDSALPTMRGVNTTYTGSLAQPGVIAYFAEVPTPTGGITVGNYLDLETISVLKGPQGTLFGRNTIGGAILLQPRKPTNEFGGYVQGIVGDFNRHDAEGAVDLPLVKDKLLLRVAGSIGHRDGYTKDIVTGRDYDNRDYWSARGSLLWRPNDKIENLLIGSGSNSSSNGSGNVLLGFDNGAFSTANLFAALGIYPSLSPILANQEAMGPRRVAHNVPGESTELRLAGLQDKFSWEVSPEITINNIVSYYRFRQRWGNGMDEDGTPVPLYDLVTPYAGSFVIPPAANGALPLEQLPKQGWASSQDIFTEELQLQGKAFANKLQYTIGGYYEDSSPDGYSAQASTAFALLPSSPFYSAKAQTAAVSFSKNSSNSKAVYAQATYDLGGLWSGLDGMSITAGYRHTFDEVKSKFAAYNLGIPTSTYVLQSAFSGGLVSVANLTPATGSCAYGGGSGLYRCGTTTRVSFDAGTWTLGLDYKFAPDQMVYFAHRRGYKAGGFNNSAPDNLRGYAPETVTDYEVGYKGDWHLGSWKFRTNIDAYYSRYKNIQQVQVFSFPVSGTNVIGAVVLNGSTAQIYGVDVEATIVPVKWVEFSGFYSHTDAHYDHYYDTYRGDYPSPACGTVCVSSYHGEIPGVPEHKASASMKLTMPVPDSWGDLSLTTYFTYQSHFIQSIAAQNPQGLFVRGYSLVNMSLDWNHIAESPVSGSLFVTNLTDKIYQTGTFGGFRGLGFLAAQYGEPRMYGLRIRYDFGS